MKVLGMKFVHLLVMISACLAISVTMVGCGDDDGGGSKSDSGVDGGEAGKGGQGGSGGTGGTGGTDAGVDAGDDAGGDDAGADAG